MRTIEEIIDEWKVEFGVFRSGKSGQYRSIPFEGRKDLLNILCKTMIDEGHGEEAIKSDYIRLTVVNSCSPPDGANIKASNLLKWKNIVAKQWAETKLEFYRGKFSEYKAEDRVKPIAEEKTNLKKKYSTEKEISPEEMLQKVFEPKNRLVSTQKIDRSQDTNWELLAELGIEADEATNE